MGIGKWASHEQNNLWTVNSQTNCA